MKKTLKIHFLSGILLLSILITACGGLGTASTPKSHVHSWTEASCSSPKTCIVCGEIEGEPLSHNWTDATLYAPKTCTLCGETTGSKLQKVIPDKYNLVHMLEALPIAKSTMDEDTLRDLVVAFMKVQLTFAYTPTFENVSSYQYYIKNLKGRYGFDGCQIKFESGKYYGGIPYVGNAAGNLYRWLPFYDLDTGTMDWTPIINSRRLNWEHSGTVYPDVGSAIFGNSCSSSCFWAWGRISNTLKSCWTSGWLPKNGYVKVGNYLLANNDTKHGSDTKELCKANGTDVMYASYAAMKRADGLVQTGHAIMIISDPVVVYNADGSIDGDNSYVLFAEQKASFLTDSPSKGGTDLYSPLNNNGITYRIMGNYPGTIVNDTVREMKWSFSTLYSKGFLPFTVPELVDLDPVEDATASITCTSLSVTLDELNSASVSSNYFISDVQFSVVDPDGNETFIGMYAKAVDDYLEYVPIKLSEALTNNRIYKSRDHIQTELSKYVGKGYTLIINCRVSTGELLTVYAGTLK